MNYTPNLSLRMPEGPEFYNVNDFNENASTIDNSFQSINNNVLNTQSEVNQHKLDKSNPHEVTKDQVGLGNVENKSSATIRHEITYNDIVRALGYEPTNMNAMDCGDAYSEERLLQVRRDLQTEWESSNYILKRGEPGFAYDTLVLKIGDGVNSWNHLKPVNYDKILAKANEYTDDVIEELVGEAPAALDTIYELARAMAESQEVIDALNSAITNKADKTVATVTDDGLMSSSDKVKLNGIAPNANNYVHPSGSGYEHIPSGGSSGKVLVWSADGYAVWDNVPGGGGGGSSLTYSLSYDSLTDEIVLTGSDSSTSKISLPTEKVPTGNKNGVYLTWDNTNACTQWVDFPGEATTSTAGLMSASDKTKLNNISGSGNTIPIGGSSGQYLGWYANGDASWQTILSTQISYTNTTSHLSATNVQSAIDEVVSNMVTKAVNDLTYYYTKSDTYTKTEVNNLISAIPTFNIAVVNSLPTTDISTTTIYLLRNTAQTGTNIFTEYIYVNSAWEILGSQDVDLSGYYTSAEVDNLLSAKVNTSSIGTAAGKNYTTSLTASNDLPTANAVKNYVDGIGNTTYTFTDGTNGFTVTPSGGTAQTVNITPSIANNVTGSGTSGYIAKFDGNNTITNGPQLGNSTNTFLRNDGTWGTPAGTNYTEGTGIDISANNEISLESGVVTASSAGPTANVTGTDNSTIKVPRITVDTYGRVTNLTEYTLTNKDTAYGVVSSSANGLMSSGDYTKLQGISSGAEVNQNSFSNVTVGSSTIAAGSKTDTVTLVAGSGITLTPNTSTKSITIGSNLPSFTRVTGTLTAGATSVTLTNNAIKTTSRYMVFTSVYGLTTVNVSISTGSATLTYEAQSSAVDIELWIYDFT